jgi:hypothetical protein
MGGLGLFRFMDEEQREQLGEQIEKLSNLLGGEALPLDLSQKHAYLVSNLKDVYKALRAIYVAAGGEDAWAVYDNHLAVK